MGLHSTQIHDALGYADSEYVALRENIAFFGIEKSRPNTPSFGRSSSASLSLSGQEGSGVGVDGH